jgi:hypothetical protein
VNIIRFSSLLPLLFILFNLGVTERYYFSVDHKHNPRPCHRHQMNDDKPELYSSSIFVHRLKVR